MRDQPKGYLETYILAFFATARLVDQHGFPAAAEYMKTGNFRRSFHMTPSAFASDFAGYLSATSSAEKSDAALMPQPNWKVDDEWTYAVKYPGEEPKITRKILREDKFEGDSVYVLKAASREAFYSKKTLERLATTKDGRLSSKRLTPSRWLSWPLSLGKRWQDKYYWRDFETGSEHKVNRSIVVSEIRDVTVLAGTFLAAKIQVFDFETGLLLVDYWYAPATKSIIKLRDYSDISFREEELASFKIN